MNIIIVSGFLGAGKTTFINEFINRRIVDGKRFVVLVNEFGDISIDGDLVRKDGLEVIEMASGCICCSLRASLPEAIDMIFERFEPDVLLIEPSGIATPGNVLNSIKSSKFSDEYAIKSVICIVDATSFFDFAEDFGEFYREQIRESDIILINKIDLIDETEIGRIEKEIEKINPNAIAVRTTFCRYIPENSDHSVMVKSTESNIELIMDSISVIPKRRFATEELKEILKDLIDGKFGRVVRAKGFVDCNELCMFQISGKNFEIIRIDEKNSRGSNVILSPKAVFIGEDLKKQEIQRIFQEQK